MRTICRRRSTPAPAPPAAPSPRPMDCIWCGWIIEAGFRRRLPKISVEHAAVNLRQLLQVRDRRAFVDLVHGLAHQAELDHRAMAGDEARVGGAAAGAQFRLATGDLFDRAHREI